MSKFLLRRAALAVPPGAVRWLNRAQFRYRGLGRVLRVVGEGIARGEGVIARGPGAGLKIDASGGGAGYVLGTAEPDEQAFLAQQLRPGDCFYDIGANIGFFTLIAAQLVGPSGSVVAFEPLPTNIQQLRRNVMMNRITWVTTCSKAVAARSGTGVFGDHQGRRAAARLAREGEEPWQGIEVDTVAIDEWLRASGARSPTLMKIDAEGSEIEVLQGAKRTITAHRPTILVEVHWLGESFLDYVREEISPLGYVTRTLDGSNLPSEITRYHAVLTPLKATSP